MTLLRENLVDLSCILDGQKTTLYTAIGQPFEAKFFRIHWASDEDKALRKYSS
jgi:hypothetical protein